MGKPLHEPGDCRFCGGTGKKHPENDGTQFNCNDCKRPGSSFMVYDHIWREAWPTYREELRALREKYKGTSEAFRCHLNLCLQCLQERLGRQLLDTDFDPALPINESLVVGAELGVRLAARNVFAMSRARRNT